MVPLVPQDDQDLLDQLVPPDSVDKMVHLDVVQLEPLVPLVCLELQVKMDSLALLELREKLGYQVVLVLLVVMETLDQEENPEQLADLDLLGPLVLLDLLVYRELLVRLDLLD